MMIVVLNGINKHSNSDYYWHCIYNHRTCLIDLPELYRSLFGQTWIEMSKKTRKRAAKLLRQIFVVLVQSYDQVVINNYHLCRDIEKLFDNQNFKYISNDDIPNYDTTRHSNLSNANIYEKYKLIHNHDLYNIAIYDVDGTLVDISKRLSKSRDKNGKINYTKFFDQQVTMELDEPIDENISHLIDSYKRGDKVVIVSGRPESMLETTYSQLRKFCVATGDVYIHLLPMILKQGTDPNDQLTFKRMVYDTYFRRHSVVAAYDDNQEVMDFYQTILSKALVV